MERPVKNDQLAYRLLGKEYFILDHLVHKKAHKLNAVASFIWDHCDGRSTEDLLELLVENYNVDKTRAKEDLTAVLKSFSELGLVE